MAVSRMLKMQLVAHVSIEEDLKRYLREAGVVEVTEAVPGAESSIDEDLLKKHERLLEQADGTLAIIEPFVPPQKFLERLSAGPIETSLADIARSAREVDVESLWREASALQTEMRRLRDELAWSRDLVRSLAPWRSIGAPLESLSTDGYATQFWTLPAKGGAEALALVLGGRPLVHSVEIARAGGRLHAAIIVARREADGIAEALKLAGGYRSAFEGLRGSPAAIIEAEERRWESLERDLAAAEDSARALAANLAPLRILSDHHREQIALAEVERRFARTDRTFVLEGWLRAHDRRRLERELDARFRDIVAVFREPREGEDPPVDLVNARAVRPFEFVMTLYGRPLYGEIDPTPYLAPFFIVFFGICMGDAGYGSVLAILSSLALKRLRLSGGLRQLFTLLALGGCVAVIVGIFTGGFFGISAQHLPAWFRRLTVLSPLDEPMRMLNVAFLLGFVHILFGMGIKMVLDFKARVWTDAIFDDLLWICLLLALSPVIFGGILGGEVDPAAMRIGARVSIGLAAVLFFSNGRKEKKFIMKIIKGLTRFYSITGYFGDVLSYARLLALGLAGAAIAMAINGIAGMVVGLPYFVGYLLAGAVLLLGHVFNLAVNILGSFVHSGRLQYLEFFNKFFNGGGREFKPFASERRYTVLKEARRES